MNEEIGQQKGKKCSKENVIFQAAFLQGDMLVFGHLFQGIWDIWIFYIVLGAFLQVDIR